MKLKEFIKKYYDISEDVNIRGNYIDNVYHELILPGTFKNLGEFKKTCSWNLDRNVYFREVVETDEGLSVKLTTGKLDLYLNLDDKSEFLEYLDAGLKKHREYRKENLSWDPSIKYLFYSRRYE